VEVNILFKDIQFVTDVEGTRTGAIISNEDYEDLLASHDEVIGGVNPDSQQSVEPSREEIKVILQSVLAAVEQPGEQETAVQTEAN